MSAWEQAKRSQCSLLASIACTHMRGIAQNIDKDLLNNHELGVL